MQKKGDVYWTLPHQKRYFGTTTISSDDLIISLSEDNRTVMDVYNLIVYDPDAKEVLKKFIDAGYENFIMKDFITFNDKGIYRMKDKGKIIYIPKSDLKKVISNQVKIKARNININLENEMER